MYMVYWMEATAPISHTYVPQSQQFGSSEMTAALQCCEQLRTRRRNGEPISFVTFVSEDPNQVGQAGVDTVADGKLPDGADYTWRKRRP